MGKNQCWKKSEQFLQVVQCISDRVSICRTHPWIQLPELGSLCFHVVKMTTEMKITSHPCITLKNWWSAFIHTSSLIMPTVWEGKLRLPGLSSQTLRECPLWLSGGIPAPRPVFLPTCHSCSLFRFEESFVTAKLSILVSFHFKVLIMKLIHFFIFSDMCCFQAKKILTQPFGCLFDIWSLLALGVCAPWSMTAWEGLGVRTLFPANS